MIDPVVKRGIVAEKEAAKKWLIAYTMPKAERQVLKKLETLGICAFLPTQIEVRKWRDRRKKLEVPLFPNYIFVQPAANRLYDPLQVKQIVKYVSFEGRPATISETLVDSLKRVLKGDFEVSAGRIECGMTVRVEDGPFVGIEGKLTRFNGGSRLIIEISAMKRTVSVEISKYSVSPVI